jgi:DNA-binding transcriptional MerR regulator
MATLYTPKRAAELLRISPSAIRLYTTRYKKHLSSEAGNTPRRFTDADLRFVAFVGKKTEDGKSHDAILAYLETPEGEAEYDDFEWTPPGTEKEPVIDAGPGTMLVPVERLVAVQAMLQNQQEERQRLLERERELLDQVSRLQREVGKAEGKIESLETQLAQQQPRRKPPTWWVRLFGGGE